MVRGQLRGLREGQDPPPRRGCRQPEAGDLQAPDALIGAASRPLRNPGSPGFFFGRIGGKIGDTDLPLRDTG
nr:hypothetical protein SHINE37_42229 [Rhizobiaceae bacterium]